jgi:hypothetical protein
MQRLAFSLSSIAHFNLFSNLAALFTLSETACSLINNEAATRSNCSKSLLVVLNENKGNFNAVA